MDDNKTGGAAFPTPVHNLSNDGMTLRDYFAAKAMQSLLAEDVSKQPHECMGQEWVSRLSYSIADTMLTERDKQKQEGM